MNSYAPFVIPDLFWNPVEYCVAHGATFYFTGFLPPAYSMQGHASQE